MGLSARTDDQTGLPIGEGYILKSTSAGNALIFLSPAEAELYRAANPGQFIGTSNDGDNGGNFNNESQMPAES